MADRPPDPDADSGTGDETGVEPDRGSTAGTPRWVKAFGIIALVVLLLFVILMFAGGGGGHRPGRHTGGGDTPPSVVIGVGGHTPPVGLHL